MTHEEKKQLYQKLGALAVDMPDGARWCPMVLLSDIKKVLDVPNKEATE